MKKMFKCLLITILTLGFMGNVNALISVEDIDFDNKVAAYDYGSNVWNIMGTTIPNYTHGFYLVSIADEETYNSLLGANSSYYSDPTDSTKLELGNLLIQCSNIDDSAWSSERIDAEPGNAYIEWHKITNNETNVTTYSFAIYRIEGVKEGDSSDDYYELTNPDTGINPLYLIPVMAVVGSVLVFKKKKYEY